MKRFLMFTGVTLGTILLIAGIVYVADGDTSGWMYILGAVVAFILALTPGIRARKAARPPGA